VSGRNESGGDPGSCCRHARIDLMPAHQPSGRFLRRPLNPYADVATGVSLWPPGDSLRAAAPHRARCRRRVVPMAARPGRGASAPQCHAGSGVLRAAG